MSTPNDKPVSMNDLTARDWIALSVLLIGVWRGRVSPNETPEWAARGAYKQADAMLTARKAEL